MRYDYVIVGGGHNGLVASIVLAMHGARVAVLEARGKVGGESSDGEYMGVRYPRVAYALGLFPRDLASFIGLDLDSAVYYSNPSWVAVEDGREWFRRWLSDDKVEREFDALGLLREYRELRKYIRGFNECSRAKGILYTIDPPSLEEAGELLEECMEGLGRMTVEDWERGLGRIIPGEAWGLFTFPTLYSEPGFASLYINMNEGLWGQPRGGMDSFTGQLYSRAIALGVDVYTGKRAARILVDGGRARGVATVEGKVFEASRGVLLSTSILCLPKLLEGENLERYLSRRERRLLEDYARIRIPLVRVNFVTQREPRPPTSRDYRPVPIVSINGGNLWGEASYPTMNDPALRGPKGLHAVTFSGAFIGSSIQEIGEALGIHEPEWVDVVDTGEGYCNPNGLPSQVPMTRHSLLNSRPLKGWGNYRTPIPGLYHGAASSHPGGEVTGIPGHNAAIRMLADSGVKPKSPLIKQSS